MELEISEEIELEAQNLIVDHIQQNDLIFVNSLIESSFQSIVSNLEKNNPRGLELLPNLFYHKSIINTANRGITKSSDCKCTPHPAHLLGKTYFLCQEDASFSVSELKNAINDYVNEGNTLTSEDENLMSYLDNTNAENIRFDDYYNFYIPQTDFINMLKGIKQGIKQSSSSNTAMSGDCGWYCPFGCGTDLGCCGNYSGCCIYRNIHCYVHDVLCITCTPAWFCGPACVPELTVVVPCP